MILKDKISENLKALRAKYQLSQEEFARRAGMHQRTYGRLESGEHWQTLESLEKISSAYHIDLAVLLSQNNSSKHPLDEFKQAFDHAADNQKTMLLNMLGSLNKTKDVSDGSVHSNEQHNLSEKKNTIFGRQ